MAMFVALALAIQLLPTPHGAAGLLRFSAFPLILSGFLLGPRAGLWVGAVTDVLDFMLFPKGKMFFPGYTLTSALTAALPALVAGKGPPAFWRYLAGVAVGQGLTKILMVPFFMALLVGEGSLFAAWSLFAGKNLIAQAFHVPLYAWASVHVVRAVRGAQAARGPAVAS